MKKTKSIVAFVILLVLTGACSKTSELIILHVNDTHSHFEAENGIGGYSLQYSAIEEARSETSNVLLMHAGDMMTGTVYCNIFGGEMNVELMNIMGYNFMVIGNHEFDQGISNLFQLQDEAKFTMLSANIMDNESGETVFKSYVTTNIAGISMAVIGLTVSDPGPHNPEIFDVYTIENEFTALSNLLVSTALAETNELMVLLTHVGIDTDEKLAEAFPEIDLIIGGHSHTLVNQPIEIGDTWVVQTGSESLKLGRLDLRIRNGSVVGRDYTLLKLNGSTYTNSTVIDDYIAEKEEIVEAETGRIICSNAQYLANADLGVLISDILVASTGADMAAMNSGGIRDYLSSGNVSIADIYEIYPFDNNVIIATLTGETLYKLVDNTDALYYSSEVEIEGSGNNMAITVNGKEIGKDDTVTFAVSDFLFNGGDNITEFSESLSYEDTGLAQRDLLIQYIDENVDVLDKTEWE